MDWFGRKSSVGSSEQWVPNFIKKGLNDNGKKLIILQLAGGNDGLNTVVPYRNDIYYAKRPKIALAKQHVFKTTDELGLNKQLPELQNLFDKGFLTVLNNVGYPNPDHSHFRSMDIWQSGGDGNSVKQSGWIGRYLDAYCQGESASIKAYEVNNNLSYALKGKQTFGFAANSPELLFNSSKDPFFKAIIQQENKFNPNIEYLYKTLAETVETAQYLHETHQTYQSKEDFPQTKIGEKLKTIAELINSDAYPTIYYASHNGFDTHAAQVGTQNNLLNEFDQALGILVKELFYQRKLDDTLILVFSEFGRRVGENANEGTDHGTANNTFLIGSKLKTPGFYNEMPNLNDLIEDDLIFSIDYRGIYASILANWLEADDQLIMEGKHKHLNLI